MNRSLPHAVVLGLSPTGLYVARELDQLSVPLLGVDRLFSCASLSRHFRSGDGVWQEPSATKLLDRLIVFSSGLKHKPVLIPTNDYYIEFIIRNHARLHEFFHIPACYANIAEALLDKLKFHQLCTEHGIASPGVWDLSDIFEGNRCIDEIPLPCILKPKLIHLAKSFMRGNKILLVSSQGEFISLAKSLPAETGGWLVQEIIPGAESEIALVAGYSSNDESGCHVFTARKLRQYPPGFGSASNVISENIEDARTLTLQLLASIGFKGIYGAEFKRDPRDGKLKIIEINPRPTLWFQLSHAAGKNLAQAAYCDLVGLTTGERKDQVNGVVWRYALKDYASALFYKLNGKNFIFPSPDMSAGGATKQRCWPVFSKSDPLPVLAELYVYVSKFFRRLF